MGGINVNQSLLKGVTIIDTTINLPGPVAGGILASLGARVIKIEPPMGDPVSTSPELYRAINDSKEIITIDLKQQEGQDKAKELIANADGILVGMRDPALKKLGLDYQSLTAINPRLIYCNVTGFPGDSTKADHPGHDLTYLAHSGLLKTLFPDLGKIPTQLADMTGALYGALAVVSGLNYQKQNKTGISIDVNLYESPFLLGLVPRHDPKLASSLDGSIICYRVYETEDGKIALGALEQKFFDSLVTAIERPEWCGQQLRPAIPGDPIFEELKSIFKSRPTAEWLSIAAAHDVPIEAVNDLSFEKGLTIPFRTQV